MSTIVFDTETTGLQPHRPFTLTEAWSKCRIVEIAWSVFNSLGDLIKKESYLIKPDGFTIPEESTKIHGITNIDALTNGVEIQNVLQLLANDIEENGVTKLVAHNIEFDDNVVQAELWRYRLSDAQISFQKPERICTMKMGTEKNKKWPKLIDLYKRLFGKVPTGVCHRAGFDVELCSQIYYVLI